MRSLLQISEAKFSMFNQRANSKKQILNFGRSRPKHKLENPDKTYVIAEAETHPTQTNEHLLQNLFIH